jgi:hypothetical protein
MIFCALALASDMVPGETGRRRGPAKVPKRRVNRDEMVGYCFFFKGR